MPKAETTSNPGKVSEMAGMRSPGSLSLSVVPSTLSLPARTYSFTGDHTSNMSGTRPESTSACAAALPP